MIPILVFGVCCVCVCVSERERETERARRERQEGAWGRGCTIQRDLRLLSRKIWKDICISCPSCSQTILYIEIPSFAMSTKQK